MAIDFRTGLDAVDADQLLGGIMPIEDSIVANAKLAQAGQIFRHPNQPPMHHDGGIFGKPLDFALDTRANGGIQIVELRVGLAAYFDPVGHGRWRGFHGLNFPALSSRRAARSSDITLGLFAVSQSCNSSSVSTEERTPFGISTVCDFIAKAYTN